jgi:predicted small lipoprotein YifL
MLISHDPVRVGASFAPTRAPTRRILGIEMRRVPMIVLGLLLATTGCTSGGPMPVEPPAAPDAPTAEQSVTPPERPFPAAHPLR